MRKIRIFQQSGYISLDLAAGTGEFFRLRGTIDLAALAIGSARAISDSWSASRSSAPEGEPLRLEFESFCRGGARREAGRRHG